MYYAEKMINGVLHYRYSPNESWRKASLEQCNKRLADLFDQIDKAYQKGRKDRANEIAEKLTELIHNS